MQTKAKKNSSFLDKKKILVPPNLDLELKRVASSLLQLRVKFLGVSPSRIPLEDKERNLSPSQDLLFVNVDAEEKVYGSDPIIGSRSNLGSDVFKILNRVFLALALFVDKDKPLFPIPPLFGERPSSSLVRHPRFQEELQLTLPKLSKEITRILGSRASPDLDLYLSAFKGIALVFRVISITNALGGEVRFHWVREEAEFYCPDCLRMERNSPYNSYSLGTVPGSLSLRCFPQCVCALYYEKPFGPNRKS